MKRSCGKGREDNVFSEKRVTPALLLTSFLLSMGMLISPVAIGGQEPPQGLNEPIFWTENKTISGQDWVVLPNQTLFISAGVNVFFENNRGLDVRGKVIANGTPDKPIQFTIDPMSYPNTWRSIAFIEDKGSVLNHVMINTARTAAYISSSSPRFVNSDIWVTRSAIVVDSRSGPDSYPVFENCTIFSGLSYFDFDVSGNSTLTALNTSYNKSKTRIGDPTAHLETQWFLEVRVDSLGEPIEDADVIVEDNANGTVLIMVPTNENGVSDFIVTEHVINFGYFGGNITYYTPHSYSVSKLGFEDTAQETVWIDANKLLNVVLYDREAPITTLVISSPSFGQYPTYVGSATEFSFEVNPGGKQPVETFYRIDDGDLTTYSGAPFQVQGEGNHEIEYYSSDAADNNESSDSTDIFLDTTPPSISATLNPGGEGDHPVVIESETNFSLEYSDEEGSGVSIVEYSVNGEPYQEYLGATNHRYPQSCNISFRALDHVGNQADGEIWFLLVAPVPTIVNDPPSFTGIPIEGGVVGREYVYHAAAVDPNQDVLSYSLVVHPMGMSVDSSTGLVTWTPTKDQIGQNLVMIAVSDGLDNDVQVFYIRVHEAQKEADDFIFIMGALGVTMAIIGSSIGVTEYGRYRFLLYFVVPLYSKLNKEKVLNQFLRGQIYGYIMAYPGENYSSIKKALNVENGTLTHHLYILEREGFVTSRVDGRYKRFYPSGTTARKKIKTSMIQKAILKMIRQNPSITQTEIAESLETSKQVVNYHVKSLVNDGMLSVSKNGSSLEYKDLSRKRGD